MCLSLYFSISFILFDIVLINSFNQLMLGDVLGYSITIPCSLMYFWVQSLILWWKEKHLLICQDPDAWLWTLCSWEGIFLWQVFGHKLTQSSKKLIYQWKSLFFTAYPLCIHQQFNWSWIFFLSKLTFLQPL